MAQLGLLWPRHMDSIIFYSDQLLLILFYCCHWFSVSFHWFLLFSIHVVVFSFLLFSIRLYDFLQFYMDYNGFPCQAS